MESKDNDERGRNRLAALGTLRGDYRRKERQKDGKRISDEPGALQRATSRWVEGGGGLYLEGGCRRRVKDGDSSMGREEGRPDLSSAVPKRTNQQMCVRIRDIHENGSGRYESYDDNDKRGVSGGPWRRAKVLRDFLLQELEARDGQDPPFDIWLPHHSTAAFIAVRSERDRRHLLRFRQRLIGGWRVLVDEIPLPEGCTTATTTRRQSCAQDFAGKSQASAIESPNTSPNDKKAPVIVEGPRTSEGCSNTSSKVDARVPSSSSFNVDGNDQQCERDTSSPVLASTSRQSELVGGDEVETQRLECAWCIKHLERFLLDCGAHRHRTEECRNRLNKKLLRRLGLDESLGGEGEGADEHGSNLVKGLDPMTRTSASKDVKSSTVMEGNGLDTPFSSSRKSRPESTSRAASGSEPFTVWRDQVRDAAEIARESLTATPATAATVRARQGCVPSTAVGGGISRGSVAGQFLWMPRSARSWAENAASRAMAIEAKCAIKTRLECRQVYDKIRRLKQSDDMIVPLQASEGRIKAGTHKRDKVQEFAPGEERTLHLQPQPHEDNTATERTVKLHLSTRSKVDLRLLTVAGQNKLSEVPAVLVERGRECGINDAIDRMSKLEVSVMEVEPEGCSDQDGYVALLEILTDFDSVSLVLDHSKAQMYLSLGFRV